MFFNSVNLGNSQFQLKLQYHEENTGVSIIFSEIYAFLTTFAYMYIQLRR